ncbi:MAG: alpha-galactosidase [Lachnospiraceae bacterium]|nr:alpha-galactosidase [Lachnospiraceae bacterium]
MITFNKENKTFKLDTPSTSYVFGIEDDFGYLVHYYYGKKIKGDNVRYLAITDKNFLPCENKREKMTFMDCTAFEYSTKGVGDFRTPAISVKNEIGAAACEFAYVSHEIKKGKKTLCKLPSTFADENDCDVLEITLVDKCLDLRLVLVYGVFNDFDVITRSVRVENMGAKPVILDRVLSASLDLDQKEYELITLFGTWARERTIERKPLRHGYQGVASMRGITSAQEHPFLALVTPGTTQTQGEVYAMNFVYSGNFEAGVYLNQFSMPRMTMGINSETFEWKLNPTEVFESPETVMIYSSEGLGKMTRTFHDLYRNHLIRSPYKNKKRPILINNWEATYFDFNTEKLLSIAREAAKTGIEMLVMDDGWFGKRNDDNSSLGDWIVNEEKLPGGLKYLVDEVNKLGLKFGIWMEPEMVCPDSDLYRAHPDWAIAIPGREAGLCRNQYVLDITRAEVLEYVWNAIKNVMDSANIEYVKWDMNRPLADIASLSLPADRMGEFFHRYVLSVYELQRRLTDSYPELLLENCSSGGGRFDPGMLFFSPQIWCSDDTDAMERLHIQEGTAIVYPLSSMGAHVSDCPNHVLGRSTDFETRGHVALAGTFGYELDITKISEEERNMIPKQVEMYHKFNDLVREGDYYRLMSARENGYMDSWMVKSKDDNEVLVTYVSVVNRANEKPVRIFLQGLDPDKIYTNQETGESYGGDILMNAGIVAEKLWGDHKSRLVHFKVQ